MNVSGPGWLSGSDDAIGQTGEFLVWAALIQQSGGGLHVFLPMLDRGIDGLIHRLEDGAYLAVQVKAKTALHGNEAPIAVFEDHLSTDDQLIVGVFLDGEGLGPFALVVDAASLKRKAGRVLDRGRVRLVVDMPTRPIPGHKWSEDLVPLDQLAARLGAKRMALRPPHARETEPPSDQDHLIGFWGELEVCRRLAMLEDCALFRPFPDNETPEILVRRLPTGATIGIQVKTAQLAESHADRRVLVHRSSFVAAATTFIVALAWINPERRFHETCLVIPSEWLPSIARKGSRYFEVYFHPDGSSEPSKVDKCRLPLEALAAAISGHFET